MSRMILALSLLPTTASAAVLTVPTDYPTVQEAIDASVADDTISLLAGTYDVELLVDKDLTISAPDGEIVVLSNTVGTSGQVIDVVGGATGAANFTIANVFFANSGTNRAIRTTDVNVVTVDTVEATSMATAGDGAFLLATNADRVTLGDVRVTGVTAANGGAVAAIRTSDLASRLTLVDSTFESGEVSGNGGLIYVQNANLNMTDTTITDGFALNGGGVYSYNENSASRPVIAVTSLIAGNFAAELGGGVYAEQVTVQFNETSVSFNSAGSGGGIWFDQGAEVENLNTRTFAQFLNNQAHGMGSTVEGMAGTGAAIHASTNYFDLDQTDVENNSGIEGAIWVTAGEADIDRSNLLDNTSTGAGGAVFMAVEDEVRVKNTAFNDNSAGGDGGALHFEAASVELQLNTFADNASGGAGGALWLTTPVDLDPALTPTNFSILTTTFTDNSAMEGGAIFRTGADVDLSVQRSEFFRNSANDGGAVHASGIGELDFTRNHWCENSAGVPGIGGAAYIVGTGGSATMANEGANDNAADVGGVFALSGFQDLSLQYSTFASNVATTGAVLDLTDNTEESILSHLAVTGSMGTVFNATTASATGTLLADRIGTGANDAATLDGAWAAATIVDPLSIDNVYLYNHHPADSCENTRLYPHARNHEDTTTSPIQEPEGSLLEDIGLSGGPGADFLLTRDGDNDGFDLIDDCDDSSSALSPTAVDVCDGIDNDCDNGGPEADDGLDEDPDTLWFADEDDDGYGTDDPAGQFPDAQCLPPAGAFIDNDRDCNDDDELISPDADEVCDTIDNDCDGEVDIGASDATEYFPDDDVDGFGRDTDSVFECSQPDGYTLIIGDCDDALANVFPGAIERCDTIDNDCDGDVDIGAIDAPEWFADTDLDGFGLSGTGVVQCLPPLDHSPYEGDCDDTDPDRNPGENEICDSIDNDCDGTTDVDPVAPLYFTDGDMDGFGDATSTPIGSCTPIPGRILDGTDCNDAVATVYPGAPESCDGVDEDCDGTADDNPTNGNAYFLDSDLDGFGNTDFVLQACTLPNFASEIDGDCNDQNANQFPGNDEFCDQLDNDCDGDIDEPDAIDAITWYADVDDDNYGSDDQTNVGCTAPIGHVPQGGDCDDENPSSFPNRPEVCDGIDNDCNGQIDGADAADVQFFYEDADGDGFGNGSAEIGACFLPEGYTTNDSDCDDTSASVFPGASEIFGNGIDEDCDGQDPAGVVTPTDPEDPGCGGCSSNGSGMPLAFLPLLGALFLRRRKA